MKYYNEATAEMVSGTDQRKGIIPVMKTISPRDTCQDGFISSDSLTILDDDLSVYKKVKLNYIGEKDYLKANGFPVNERVMPDPCLFNGVKNGLKITDCGTYPDAEKTDVFEIGENIPVLRREDYFGYATSFVIHEPGNYMIIDSYGTHKVHIDGTNLKMGVNVLASLEKDRRHLVTVFKVRGVWVDYYYRSNNTIFTIVLIGDTIVGVGVNTGIEDVDYTVSTYSDGLSTYSATAYNFHPAEDMPGVLMHNYPRMWNPWWSNTMDTYTEVYTKMGPVINKVCDIINGLKGGCR